MSDQGQRSFNLEFPPPGYKAPAQEEQDNLDGNNELIQEENEPMQEEYAENGNLMDEDLLNTVAELENDFRLTHDPESGAELLGIYKKAEDIENVRRIREELLEYTTLSEKDWLDWIDDEINSAKTDEEKKKVLKLIDRALEESLFYDVAKLGISYVKGMYNKGITRKQGVKITIEKAINAFCYDFNQGSKMFKRMRKFELENTEVKNEAEKEKIIRGLYQRQLKLPYADIQQVMSEYLDWEKNAEEKKKTIKIYEETYKDIETHLDFEDKFQEALESDDGEKLGEVLTEIVNTDKLLSEKKTNFFERCIVANPSELKVWEKYSEHAEKNLKTNSSALERIYRRAVKNCPGNMHFTRNYIRALEKTHTELETIKKKILSMLFSFSSSADYYSLRLQLCEVYIRMLNTKLADDDVKGDISKAKEEVIYFRQAVQEAIQFFSSDLSPEHQAYIANFWLLKAHIETYTIKDKQQMNQSMDKYVQANGSQFQAWNQYVTFEQAVGRPDSVRRILKRGCEYTKDDIAAIHTLAIEYERKFGKLEDLDEAERRFQQKKEKLAQEDPTNAALLADSDNIPKPIEQANKKLKGKGREREREGPTKRKYNDRRQADDENAKELGHIGKQVKKNENRDETKKMEEEKEAEENGANKEETMKEEKAEHPHREPLSYPEELDKRNTVFVRNLPATFTVPDIKAIFVNMDKIIEIRLGKTKGTAYIDFSTKEDAVLACENNNMKIDGQKLFVAMSDPPKKGKDDRKTLFINNLPFDITRETLAETFKKWESQITDIRIPSAADNKAKGFAYLVLDNEPVLDEVIAECKDLHVGGRKVNVEHADSSRRHQTQTAKALHVAFIRGLNFKAREQDIEMFFRDFNVRQVHLVKDKKTNKPTGIAFVEFGTMEDLRNAIALPEPKILGRQIDISKSDRPITQGHNAPAEAPEARPKKNALSKKDAQRTEEPTDAKPAFQISNDLKKMVPASASSGGNTGAGAGAPAAKSNFPIPMHIKKKVPASADNSSSTGAAVPANTTGNATGGPAPGMKDNSFFKNLMMKK